MGNGAVHQVPAMKAVVTAGNGGVHASISMICTDVRYLTSAHAVCYKQQAWVVYVSEMTGGDSELGIPAVDT